MQLDNLNERQLLIVWEEYLDNIRKATSVVHGETEAEKARRISRLEANDIEWMQYYFPKETFSEFADFQKQAIRRKMENMEWIEVDQWSRELAKSTVEMMITLKQVLTKKKRYVLLISNSLDNAIRLLMPYRAHLTSNERIIQDYGLQELPGKWAAEEFVARCGAAFRALGAGQSPRGTRNEEVRPDKIIFDDIDTDEECRNPVIILRKWQWIEEAAMATRSVSRDTQVVFLGNRIAKDCCVVRAEKIADKISRVNIMDNKGKSSWPQKNSDERITRIKATKSYASFQKEYMNNPIDEGSVFKEMAYKPARPLNEYTYLVCYTDPSFKDSKKNDYKATILMGKWKDEFHVIKAFVEQTTTAKMIEWHYEIMNIVGACGCYYYMEQVFLQDILIKEFYDAAKRNGRTIPISGDQRAKPDKFTRIESLLEPLNRNGKLYLNEREKNNTHMVNLEDQFKAFAPGSRAHDDGPDAVEGAVWIINNKETIARPGGIRYYKRQKNSKRF